jgi:hypothetical protein
MPFLGKDERLILALNFLMVEVLTPTCTRRSRHQRPRRIVHGSRAAEINSYLQSNPRVRHDYAA